jgi:hypothetical protein
MTTTTTETERTESHYVLPELCLLAEAPLKGLSVLALEKNGFSEVRPKLERLGLAEVRDGLLHLTQTGQAAYNAGVPQEEHERALAAAYARGFCWIGE